MTLVKGQRLDADSTREEQTEAFYRSRLPALLLIIYAGMLALFGARALLYSYHARLRISALPPADETLTQEVAALATRVGLRRPPRVRVDAEATSPFVAGAWSPTLVMPASLPGRIAGPAREALIVHELAHLGRGDVPVRWLQNMARVLFFFWPPVWWLCHRIERFSEMACDQWAVKFSSVSPQLYAESLLDVAKGVRAQALGSHGVGFATHKSRLMVARFEKILEGGFAGSPRLSWWTSMVLAGWGLFALTGSVLAEPGGNVPVTVSAVGVYSELQFARWPTPDSAFNPAQALENEAQGYEQGPRRTEERRSVSTRRPEATEHSPISDAAAAEVSAFQQSQRRRAGQLEEGAETPETDIDGDGTVSPYEAGYSAGLRENKRKVAQSGSSPGLDESQTLNLDGGEGALRRKEIELEIQRLKAPANSTP